MTKLEIQELELHVFRPPVSPQDRSRFDAAFHFWHEIWRGANAEMEKPTELPADAFTRQTEILTLFKGERPIALICHRHTDFAAESTFHDTLFLHPGMWRDEDKQFVRNLGGLGLIGSQITVAQDFRKTEGPLSMKYLIVLLSLARAQAVGAETIVSAIRGEKGLDKVFGGAGSLLIAPSRKYGNTFVDLIAFQPQKNPIRLHPDYEQSVSDLWSRALVSSPLEFKSTNPSKTHFERKSA